jgi:hypothetical protein
MGIPRLAAISRVKAHAIRQTFHNQFSGRMQRQQPLE